MPGACSFFLIVLTAASQMGVQSWAMLFNNFAVCVSTYFQKIAEPQDLSPTLAVGFTINHVAAVVIPVIGGALWLWDSSMVFLGGVVLSLCSLVVVQFIRTPSPQLNA